jgi:hypothetical protein
MRTPIIVSGTSRFAVEVGFYPPTNIIIGSPASFIVFFVPCFYHMGTTRPRFSSLRFLIVSKFSQQPI